MLINKTKKKHNKRKLVQDPQIEKQIAGAKLESRFASDKRGKTYEIQDKQENNTKP